MARQMNPVASAVSAGGFLVTYEGETVGTATAIGMTLYELAASASDDPLDVASATNLTTGHDATRIVRGATAVASRAGGFLVVVG